MSKKYTANQPLMLGGQIYMWNRYFEARNLIHMVEAQFSKFGHQSRIELLSGNGSKQLFIVPLEDRSFRLLNDVYVHNPTKVADTLAKTIKILYPSSKISDVNFVDGLLYTFSKNVRYSLARLNVAVTEFIWDYLFGGMDGYSTYISTEVLPVRPKDPSEWVAELGRAINCTEYLGGEVAAKAYLKNEHFSDRGMTFRCQNFRMKPYKIKKDVFNDDAYICIIDPLLRLGRDATLELISKNNTSLFGQ